MNVLEEKFAGAKSNPHLDKRFAFEDKQSLLNRNEFLSVVPQTLAPRKERKEKFRRKSFSRQKENKSAKAIEKMKQKLINRKIAANVFKNSGASESSETQPDFQVSNTRLKALSEIDIEGLCRQEISNIQYGIYEKEEGIVLVDSLESLSGASKPIDDLLVYLVSTVKQINNYYHGFLPRFTKREEDEVKSTGQMALLIAKHYLDVLVDKQLVRITKDNVIAAFHVAIVAAVDFVQPKPIPLKFFKKCYGIDYKLSLPARKQFLNALGDESKVKTETYEALIDRYIL